MDTERRGPKGILLLLPACLVFLVLYVYPLGGLLSRSFFDGGLTFRYYAQFFQEPAYLRVLWQTARLAATVTLITLALGFPVAFVLATARRKVTGALLLGILFPFWISVLVRSYAWMVLLGRRGVLNNLLVGLGLLGKPLPLLYNQFGVHVGMVYVLLPFMILPIYGSMQAFDRGLLRAAHSLGAGPLEALARVFVPLILPGVAAGCLLVFMLALGFFVTPALLGGPRDITVSMLVEKQISGLLDWRFGSAISTVLLGMTLGVFLIFGRLLRRHRVVAGV